MTQHKQGVITRAEWIERYAQRIMAVTGMPMDSATGCAEVGAEVYEQNERDAGADVVWWGGPSGENNTPEDEADEEMSYWE